MELLSIKWEDTVMLKKKDQKDTHEMNLNFSFHGRNTNAESREKVGLMPQWLSAPGTS